VLYEEFSQTDFRRFLEFPSVLAALGDAKGLRVLDFGCGSGVYSRLLADQGAGVVGMDVAEGMIAHARNIEMKKRQGIEYVTGELPRSLIGSFDLVLAVYVMPYATTYQALVEMCRTAARALRPGGRLVTLPINPKFATDREYYAPYGFRLYDHGSREDAAPLGLDLRFGRWDEHVEGRLWTEPTLYRALAECGFGTLRQHAYRVPKDAPEGFGSSYLSVPHALIIDAVSSGP
jgi:SAM-dependent methyltransferase